MEEIISSHEKDQLSIQNEIIGQYQCSWPWKPSFQHCAIRVNLPIRLSSLSNIIYFELEIVRKADATGIGLASEYFPLCEKMPGWDEHSFGIHSDDGKVFLHQGNGEPFCEPWNEDSIIVGLGVDRNGTVFFTKNGKFIKNVVKLLLDYSLLLYPTIGISDKTGKAAIIKLILEPPFLFSFSDLPPEESTSYQYIATWGHGNQGKLGHGEKRSEATLRFIQSNISFVSVSAGHDHSLAISTSGHIYSWGSNARGQLGQGYDLQDILTPTLVPTNERFIQVSAGYSHSLALSETKELYSWGSDDNGALGLKDKTFSFTPQKIDCLSQDFQSVSAGTFCSAAITDTGLFIWGKWKKPTYEPKNIFNGKLQQLAVGNSYGISLSDKGILYYWNDDEKLKLLDDVSHLKFKDISANYHHFAALTEDGSACYDWTYGQLDSFQLTYKESRGRLNILKEENGGHFVKISTGWQHLLLLADTGDIYSTGRREFSGHPGATIPITSAKKIPGFSDLVFTNISAGTEHNIVLFRNITLPWIFPTDLLTHSTWEAIGIGHNPPKKLQLPCPHLFKTPETNEYKRAESIFLNTLNGKGYKINKIFVVQNEAVETAFNSEIQKLSQKWIHSSHLFKKEDWKESHTSKRQKVMDRFNQYCNQFDWNKKRDIKIIPVVHGTNESAVWGICNSGFSSLALLNEGFYGRGIYFTSHIPYAASYSKQDTEYIFIISFIIPGNVFPVVEDPNGEESLKGKPNKVGYQSHYVSINKEGFPPEDPKKAEYDEFVIFQESQVLPRYVVYATFDKEVEPNTLPDQITFPNIFTRHSLQSLLAQIQEISENPTIKSQISPSELQMITNSMKKSLSWLSLHPNQQKCNQPFQLLKKPTEIINKILLMQEQTQEEIPQQEKNIDTPNDSHFVVNTKEQSISQLQETIQHLHNENTELKKELLAWKLRYEKLEAKMKRNKKDSLSTSQNPLLDFILHQLPK